MSLSFKTFHWSYFPIWVSSKFKSLLYKKRNAHKKYKITGCIHDYNVFSCLRSQCKTESKRLRANHSQARLISQPSKFWSFINSKRTYPSILDKVYFNDQAVSGLQIADLFIYYFFSIYKNLSTCLNTAINNMKIDEFPFLPSQLCFLDSSIIVRSLYDQTVSLPSFSIIVERFFSLLFVPFLISL